MSQTVAIVIAFIFYVLFPLGAIYLVYLAIRKISKCGITFFKGN